MARLSKTDLVVYDEIKTGEGDDYMSSPREELEDHYGARGNFEEHSAAARCSPSAMDRRISAITDTTISSMPESLYPTDNDLVVPTSKQWTTQSARQTYAKRPELRRAQLSSPIPFERYSPRSPTQRVLRSRTGTPIRSSKVRNSPLQRRAQRLQGDEAREYPLVLLHITLLPINMPWSTKSMQETLPGRILEHLQTLKSKANDTILQRGILIPHPREEYDLLEERLLEALDLRQERLTADGHFRRPRDSDGSEASTISGHSRHDSGLGSSEEDGSEDGGETCTVCRGHAEPSKDAVCAAGQKWSVRVYAANGLMKAAAWSACWPEMERVDVEITPLIPDHLRRELDVKLHEERMRKAQDEDEQDRIRTLVEEQVRLAQEEREQVMRIEQLAQEEAMARRSAGLPLEPPLISRSKHQDDSMDEDEPTYDDLPPIYGRSQVPMAVLLRNYIYVLAQDRRNAIIFFLGVIALYMGFQAFYLPSQRPAPLDLAIDREPQMDSLIEATTLSSETLQTNELNDDVFEVEISSSMPIAVDTSPENMIDSFFTDMVPQVQDVPESEEHDVEDDPTLVGSAEKGLESYICLREPRRKLELLFEQPLCLVNG